MEIVQAQKNWHLSSRFSIDTITMLVLTASCPTLSHVKSEPSPSFFFWPASASWPPIPFNTLWGTRSLLAPPAGTVVPSAAKCSALELQQMALTVNGSCEVRFQNLSLVSMLLPWASPLRWPSLLAQATSPDSSYTQYRPYAS